MPSAQIASSEFTALKAEFEETKGKSEERIGSADYTWGFGFRGLLVPSCKVIEFPKIGE